MVQAVGGEPDAATERWFASTGRLTPAWRQTASVSVAFGQGSYTIATAMGRNAPGVAGSSSFARLLDAWTSGGRRRRDHPDTAVFVRSTA